MMRLAQVMIITTTLGFEMKIPDNLILEYQLNRLINLAWGRVYAGQPSERRNVPSFVLKSMSLPCWGMTT